MLGLAALHPIRRPDSVAIVVSFQPAAGRGSSFRANGSALHAGLVHFFSLPVGLLTEAILHANNARDIDIDLRAGAKTLANTIGFAASLSLFRIIYAVCFAALPVFAIALRSPWFLLPAITLPQLPVLMAQFRALQPHSGMTNSSRAARVNSKDDGTAAAAAKGKRSPADVDLRAKAGEQICDQCGQFSFAFGALLAVAIAIG